MVIQGVFKHTNQLALVGRGNKIVSSGSFSGASECLANHMNQTGSTFSIGFQIKTLILKFEWKSKTNLSITITIKATDHLRYLRICPDEIMVAILSRSHGVIYPLPTSVKQNVNKSVLFAQVIY